MPLERGLSYVTHRCGFLVAQPGLLFIKLIGCHCGGLSRWPAIPLQTGAPPHPRPERVQPPPYLHDSQGLPLAKEPAHGEQRGSGQLPVPNEKFPGRQENGYSIPNHATVMHPLRT